jgi:hypothetical protein
MPLPVRSRRYDEAFWKDNCLALAAQLAYYFFFALFPTLLFMVALASYFPLTTLIDDLFRTMGGLMPPEALQLITDQMIKISEDKQTGLLTLGVLLAISSSSAVALRAIRMNSCDRAHHRCRHLHSRVVCAGARRPDGCDQARRDDGVRGTRVRVDVEDRGRCFRAGAQPSISPDVERNSVAGSSRMWLPSLGSVPVANWATAETYGLIGAVMFASLGASEIEHASPRGKDPGEKVRGQKRYIPARAMRRWEKWRRSRGEHPPSAEEVKAVLPTDDSRD